MIVHLPRAFEFEVVSDRWIRVIVDNHVYIYVISTDRVSLKEHRVKKGGRRSSRGSEYYRRAAMEFAAREAAARGLLAR